MSGRADSEIRIRINTEHDGAGATAANRKLDETKRAAGGVGDSLRSASRGAELFGKVLRGAGWLGIILQLVNVSQRLKNAIGSVAEAADAAAKKAEAKAAEEAVKRQKDAWDELKKSIDASTEAAALPAEMVSIARGGGRALEDARSQVAEQRELAGIDPSDVDRREKEDAVRARFARARDLTSAACAKEDA